MSPAILRSSAVPRPVCWVLLRGGGDSAYHGVPQNENGQLGVLFPHEINVLQAVPDEDVEIRDNHTITLALPMASCRGEGERASKSIEAAAATEKGFSRNVPVGLLLSQPDPLLQSPLN